MAEAGLQPNAEPRELHWRYWQERADWKGSRSYVLTDGAGFLAHAALIPLGCEVDGRRLDAAHLIDWAARPSEPGAGVMVFRHVLQLVDALIDVGGSEASLRALPILGFRECGRATGYVRSLRPLRLLASESRPSLRLMARVGRSALWSMGAPRPIEADGCSVRKVSIDRIRELASIFAKAQPAPLAFERSEALLAYMLSCPIAPMECHLVERSSGPVGYFILAFVGLQARLVDIQSQSDASADLRAVIQCAVCQAGRNAAVAELAAWGSDPLLSHGLEECGFHPRFNLPIWVRSGRAEFSPESLRVHLMDSDAAYLHEGGGNLWA